MVLPDPVGALRHVADLLSPTGRIYFTQTIHTKRAPLLEKLKPMLHRLTTIHFGRVTYQHELAEVVREAGLCLDEAVILGRARDPCFCLAIARIPTPTRSVDPSQSTESASSGEALTESHGDAVADLLQGNEA
jgi:hypothetical protein